VDVQEARLHTILRC